MDNSKSKAFAGPQHVIFGLGLFTLFVVALFYNNRLFSAECIVPLAIAYSMIPGLAIIPDIDVPPRDGNAGAMLTYQVWWIEILAKPFRIFPHRTFTHYAITLAAAVLGCLYCPYNIVSGVFFAISAGYALARGKIKGPANLGLSVLIAYLGARIMSPEFSALVVLIGMGSHDVGDMLTNKYKFFWPLPFEIGGKILQGKTNKFVMIAIFVALSAAIVHFNLALPSEYAQYFKWTSDLSDLMIWK